MKIIRKHTGYKQTKKGADGILYCADDKGLDWYELAHNVPPDEKAIHILLDETGMVVSVTDDITRLFPAGYDLISVEAPAEFKILDMVEIKGDAISVMPHSPVAFATEKAKATRDVERLISPLERARRLGMATPHEEAELDRLERYSVHLMRATPSNLIALRDF